MQFVKIPNCPSGKVILCAACYSDELKNSLAALNITLLSPASSPFLDDETASHADMLLCHTGGKDIVIDSTQSVLASALRGYGFDVTFSEKTASRAYPEDIKLNVAICSRYAAGLFSHTDSVLLSQLNKKKLSLININQGYSKCSICFVAKNAVITEDRNAAEALEAAGIETLLIKLGEVYLSDRHTGFFGGAAGLLSKHMLGVYGELSSHSDGAHIEDFLARHSVKAVPLKKGRITDIGGILPLAEE